VNYSTLMELSGSTKITALHSSHRNGNHLK